MAIRLEKETETRLLESIQRYCREEMDLDVGDLKAQLLLDFCLREIAPCAYNRAVVDVQRVLTDRVSDLQSDCYEPEFGYWKD